MVEKPKRTSNGCATCKRMHKKCDETKPICLRCKYADRQCDYVPLVTVPIKVWGTPAERRALHFYRHAAAPEMSDYFDTPFWTASVIRISQDIPAAKHVLVAVASIYETLRFSQDDSRQRLSNFAISQISKSTNLLLNEARSSLIAILVCCILFNIYGHLVDDLSIFPHLKGGLDLVDEVSACPDHFLLRSMDGSKIELVHTLLIPVLRRLSQCFILVDPIQAFRQSLSRHVRVETPAPTPPYVFPSLFEAEAFQVALQRWVLGGLEPATTLSGYRLTTDRVSLLNSISQQFVDAINRFYRRSELAPPSPSLARPASLLKLNHYSLLVCLKAMNFVRETEFDALESTLFQIKACCEENLDASRYSHSQTKEGFRRRRIRFGTEHSLNIPLHIVSKFSRNPVLRRQAIDLMGAVSIEEGFAETVDAASVATRVMEIEEEGLPNITCAADIPESKRIRLHDGVYFRYSSRGAQLRIRYMNHPYYQVKDEGVWTKELWFNLSKRGPLPSGSRIDRDVNDDSSAPKYTPNSIEDIIAAESRSEEPPPIILTASKIASIDASSRTPPLYHIITPSHPFSETETLRF